MSRVPMMAGSLGFGWWWMFPVVGMAMMVVVAVILIPRALREWSRTSVQAPPADPLVIARERYAQGRISKSEFDELVQRLVNTEDGDS